MPHKRSNLGTLTLGVTLALTGCGDAMSHSADARHDGMKLYSAGAYEDATGAFKAAVRSNPRDHLSYYYLGKCYEASGAYTDAIGAYKASLETLPRSIHARNDKKQNAEIFDALANAIAKAPGKEGEIAKLQNGQSPLHGAGRTSFLLAKVHIAGGDPDAAIEAYQEATKQAPKDQEIFRSYGLWLASIGQGEPAKAPLTRAYALDDQDAEVIAALRSLGVVVGPSLKNENEIARPFMPKGPIPEVIKSK